MSGCTTKTIDVFVTHDETTTDEVWQAPVWSVEVRGSTAYVANWETPWVMTAAMTWPLSLEKGDQVRVGSVGASAGYTDYMTVLEKVQITQIANAVNGVSMPLNGGPNNGAALAGPTLSNGVWATDITTPPLTSLSSTHYAYRLNHSFNATAPPMQMESRTITTDDERMTHDLAARATIQINHSWADNSPSEQPEINASNQLPEKLAKKMAYPLFKLTRPDVKLRVKLDRGVKAVHWLQLKAATFVNKRQVGFQSAHEMVHDDWAALTIEEVHGEVISNNPVASGAFAVLHTGHHDDAKTGAVELHQTEPNGLVTHYFEAPRTDLRSLTISARDRTGEPAHLGRMHLWFKLCVSHG